MGRIRTLPAHVVNQIAAGEVVDRPASVVKELLENAIDAGARRIEVRLARGGTSRIEVADDGAGMDEEDLAAAFLPHATSKLRDVADLEHIASLGFRGEALASIGSVSRAAITSRLPDRPTGSGVEDREGTVTRVRPAAAAPGTVVVVEGLFAGVPARRKFLRSPGTELGHVTETVERFAVAHPEVAFLLEHEGRSILSAPAGEERRSRIARVHGDDTARTLLHVDARDDAGLSVEAWISPPGVSRGDARLQQVYLNGRYIRDRTVQHAMREAYRDLVPPGDRQPIAFLFLSCDPARVDVNVHPTKAEVRWRDASFVHERVRRSLRGVLEASRPGVVVPIGGKPGLRPSTAAAAEWAFSHPPGVGSHAHGAAPCVHDPAPWEVAETSVATASRPTGHEAEGARHAAEGVGPDGGAPPRERLRPLGQALGTYLVFEAEDGVVLIDQHALHERVLFDRISARLRDGSLEVQHLLVPTVVSLGAEEVARLEEERDLLESLGWLVEAFGGSDVAVRAVPAVLRRPDPEAVLRDVLAVLYAGRRDGLDRAALLSSVVDRMACRAAVMAGDALHPEEVLELLAQAESLNHSHSCPHGRPTRLVLSRTDLERWFHR